jgi:hypothetical protein
VRNLLVNKITPTPNREGPFRRKEEEAAFSDDEEADLNKKIKISKFPLSKKL